MRIRPEVIIFSGKGNISYAAILKKVKADSDPRGGNVSEIQSTQKGISCLSWKNPAWENWRFSQPSYKLTWISMKWHAEKKSALKKQFKFEEFGEEFIVSLKKFMSGSNSHNVTASRGSAKVVGCRDNWNRIDCFPSKGIDLFQEVVQIPDG